MNDINLKINKIAVEFFNDNNSKFAKEMDTNEANIRNYRTGTLPKIDFIVKLVDKLEINFEWILLDKGEMIKQYHKEIEDINGSYNEIGECKEVSNELSSKIPEVVTVDAAGNDNVALVPEKAAAGYLKGHGDPKFIQKLPAYHFPNLKNGTYRMFQMLGHSMYPTLCDGSFVVGQWVENWLNDIKDDYIYVIVSKIDGILIKRVLNRIEKYGHLYCKSDNRKEYPSFQINPKDVIEIWEYKMHLSFDLPNPADLQDRVNDIEAKILFLESRMKK